MNSTPPRSGGGTGDRTDRIEHADVVLLEKRLRRSAFDEGAQFIDRCHCHQAMQFSDITNARRMSLAYHRRQQSTSVPVPGAVARFWIRQQRSGELLDIVGLLNLAEEIPFDRALVKGIEDYIAARGIEELAKIRNHSAITPPQSGAQQLTYRGALARARSADDLEVFGLVRLRDRIAREGRLRALRRGFHAFGVEWPFSMADQRTSPML
jgi:hypothetical protein